MISPKQFRVDVRKKGLEQEAYCKKMWTEINEKMSINMSRHLGRNCERKLKHKNNGGDRSG